jgi:hypothetical protein
VIGLAKEKIPDLCYVNTETGIRLPVLDITHPLFTSSIQEEKLAEMCRGSAMAAQAMKEMPDEQKKMIYEHSLIFGKHFVVDPNATYLSGMSTYVLKLGPHLLGDGDDRKIDRMISMGVSSVSVRMRVRDIAGLQADVLMPRLNESEKDLCLLNIAGGAASDSINTLILIIKRRPSLLKHRRTRILLLDIDGPSSAFAARCVEALKQPGCWFHGLDIELEYSRYDWRRAEDLQKILEAKAGEIVCGSSEGGLFEYGSDGDIVANLDALDRHSPPDTAVTGSLFHDIDRVDPTLPAMAETSGASTRFLGIGAFKGILERTNWRLDTVIEANPCYAVFTLKKR